MSSVIGKRLAQGFGFVIVGMGFLYGVGTLKIHQPKVENIYMNMSTEHLQMVAERVSQQGNIPPLLSMELIKRWTNRS